MTGLRLDTWERFSSLCLFAVAFIVLAPAGRAQIGGGKAEPPQSVAAPNPSPTIGPPSVSSSDSELKEPKLIAKLFSWVGRGFKRLFVREHRVVAYLPLVASIEASASSVKFCSPNLVGDPPCSPSTGVSLTVFATRPDNEEIFFRWAVTGGRLKGEGPSVTWDLSGVQPGRYTATVEVNDGSQHATATSTSVTVEQCLNCITSESPCPTVSVGCPSNFDQRRWATFEASVQGGDPTITPTYEWTVSGGRIVSGQGAKKIVVDISDLDGQPVTATVRVGGGHPLCRELNVASCTTGIAN